MPKKTSLRSLSFFFSQDPLEDASILEKLYTHAILHSPMVIQLHKPFGVKMQRTQFHMLRDFSSHQRSSVAISVSFSPRNTVVF